MTLDNKQWNARRTNGSRMVIVTSALIYDSWLVSPK